MTRNLKIAVFEGDGIGPEIMAPTVAILSKIADAYLDRQPYFRTMPQLLVHETGVHFIDVFRYLLGNPTHVYADLRKVKPSSRARMRASLCSPTRAPYLTAIVALITPPTTRAARWAKG